MFTNVCMPNMKYAVWLWLCVACDCHCHCEYSSCVCAIFFFVDGDDGRGDGGVAVGFEASHFFPFCHNFVPVIQCDRLGFSSKCRICHISIYLLILRKWYNTKPSQWLDAVKQLKALPANRRATLMEILENTAHGTKTNIDPDSVGVSIRRQRRTTHRVAFFGKFFHFTSLINISSRFWGRLNCRKKKFRFFLFWFAVFFLLTFNFLSFSMYTTAWHVHCSNVFLFLI